MCCKETIYRSTVVDYLKRLIVGTETALNFATIKDSAYVLSATPDDGYGRYEWDETKLDHWFYRRFLGVSRTSLTRSHMACLRCTHSLGRHP